VPSPSPSPSARNGRRERAHDRRDRDRKRHRRIRARKGLHPEGAFSTDGLVAIAGQLRRLGWPRRRILAAVYAPFIVGGPAAWTNTWGAPRFGPAPGQVRRHEGQDVFCRHGDPVLAADQGTIEFDEGGLGGRVARLHLAGGGYFYYAHLSRWNTRELSSGDPVRPGDVIGSCGDTGNARGGAPHVHFGWYGRDGKARDPMRHLIRWLRTARRSALRLMRAPAGFGPDRIDLLRMRRLFGDEFAPDRSTLGAPTEALAFAPARGQARALSLGRLMRAVVRAALEQHAIDERMRRRFLSPTPSGAAVRRAAGNTGFVAPPG
jgi:peptidoglycan LD-endopeptidase LytH